MCVRTCMCVRACVRARARARVCVCVPKNMTENNLPVEECTGTCNVMQVVRNRTVVAVQFKRPAWCSVV